MRVSRPARNFRRAGAALAVVALLVSGCKPAQLPEPASPGAQVYAQRCGNCHVPYNPHELTAAMWETQVLMMEGKMQSAGMPPLTSDERDAILDYLKRNAGTQ